MTLPLMTHNLPGLGSEFPTLGWTFLKRLSEFHLPWFENKSFPSVACNNNNNSVIKHCREFAAELSAAPD